VRGLAATVAVALTLMVFAGTVGAEPSLSGFSGLLTTPTAEALGEGEYNIGLNSGELEDWEDFSYYANFGVGQQTEVGVLLWRPDTPSEMNSEMIRLRRDETYLHIKRSFAPVDGGPTLAAGVFDLTDEVQTTVYVVADWKQGNVVGQLRGEDVRFLNLHAGFASGQFNDFFAGVEFAFGTRFEVMGEWVNDDVNVGVRLKPFPGFNVDAGLMDVEDLAVNLSYSRSY